MPRTPSAKTTISEKPDKKLAVQVHPVKRALVKKQPIASTPIKAKKSAEPTISKPSFRFYPSTELHNRLLALLEKIEASSDATLHRDKLSDSVKELTTAGFNYYFTRPLKEAKVGFVTQQSANLGLMGVQQVMAPVIRNIIGRLDHPQLQAITQSIRQLLK